MNNNGNSRNVLPNRATLPDGKTFDDILNKNVYDRDEPYAEEPYTDESPEDEEVDTEEPEDLGESEIPSSPSSSSQNTEIETEDSQGEEHTEKNNNDKAVGSLAASRALELILKDPKVRLAIIGGISFIVFLLFAVIILISVQKTAKYQAARLFLLGYSSTIDFEEYLIDQGHCTRGSDCFSTDAGIFYSKIKSVYDSYVSEYNVNLNVEVLLATLFYDRGDEEAFSALNEIDELADAMVEEYIVIEKDENGKEKEVTKYRINMDQYRDFIIGTSDDAYDMGGTSSGSSSGSSANPDKQEFLNWIAPLAQELQKVSGILPSLTIAQKIQESGWKKGSSEITTVCHNYFGMKKGSWNGPYKVFRTWEHDRSGNKYYIDAAFRCYENDVQGFIGRGDFFWSYSRYADFLVCNFKNDWKCAVSAVKNAGYATDVNYVSALTKIISNNELWKYDNDPAYQWDGNYPDYADYDPYTKQSISSGNQGQNSEINSNEQFYPGGGYLEKYRPELLKGYNDSKSKYQHKKEIYDEIIKDSIEIAEPDDEYDNSFSDTSNKACSSTPIKVTGQYKISSAYGGRNPIEINGVLTSSSHNGVDLAYPKGTPIYAVASGKVTIASFQANGCGNYVEIGHDSNDDGKYESYSVYCHMDKYIVSLGQTVGCGETIGYVGSTGASTGYHLHFGLRNENKQFVDPTPLLNQLLSKNSIFDQTQNGDGTNYKSYYNQGDYYNVPYCKGGTGHNIKSSGCAIAAITTAIANLKKQTVDLAGVANYVCTNTNYRCITKEGVGCGTYGGGLYTNEAFGQRYGIRGVEISDRSFDNMTRILQSGKKIVVSVRNGKFNASGNGHYIEINDVKDGQMYVNDVGSRANVGWHSRSVIESQIINHVNTGMWYIENR